MRSHFRQKMIKMIQPIRVSGGQFGQPFTTKTAPQKTQFATFLTSHVKNSKMFQLKGSVGLIG